jgi:superfamily II DNA or RNA helicase
VKRVLSGLRDRMLLYLQAGGQCRLCGVALPRGWHADHVVPFSQVRETKIANMQALCPACNLKKGKKTMQKTKTIDIGNSNAGAFREHQKAAFELAQQIAAGRFTSKKIFANVTPGGGKTGLASILIHELFRQGIIDRVLYVVPRVALRSQVIQSFCNDSKFNPSGYQIESAGYGPLYTDPQIGCVATYGELALKQNLIAEWAQAGRALIIFDEAHLLSKEDDSQGWAKACEFIASPARLVLAMTGTAERHDGKPIAFATYETNHATMRKFAKFDIQYTLREAIKDSAVAQPEFVRIDGRVEVAIGGKLFKGELSAAEKEKERLMLRAAITRPEYWRDVLERAIRHWENYRRDSYRSRMLVIAEDQESAKTIRDHLAKKWKTWRTALAISDIEDDPQRELEDFRTNSSADILVTCNMASIGFDVPDLTHCVYLKTWRSRPEFQQAIARAMRVNYRCGVSPGNQRAFIFTPDDPRMNDLVEEIRSETIQGVKDRAEREPNGDGPRTLNTASTFQPIRCDVIGVSMSTLDQNFSEDETWKIEAVRQHIGDPSLSEQSCLRIYGKHPEDYPRVTHGPNTPDARKQDLRSKNQDAVSELVRLRQAQTTAPINVLFQEMNAQLKAKFGRSPEEMSEAQLDSRLKTVQDLIRKERQALSLNGARTHAR